MKKVIYSIAVILLLSGCKDGSGDSLPADDGIGVLDGTWISGCQDKGGGSYEIETLVFSGSGTSVTSTETGYSDAACTTQVSEESFNASVTLVGDSPDVDGAARITLEVTGMGTMNDIVSVDTDASPNTLARGDNGTCNSGCTASDDYPTALGTGAEVYTKQ